MDGWEVRDDQRVGGSRLGRSAAVVVSCGGGSDNEGVGAGAGVGAGVGDAAAAGVE